MIRDLLNSLLRWKMGQNRRPLILRGARQVGKSWLVRELGRGFPHFIEINFEKQKSLKELFQGDLEIPPLLEKLSLYSGKKIIPGETLLFFDEVQECPEVLQALRYFWEEVPSLHVIAAGSLLDFALEKVGLPVGRVQFLHLYPLSFGEFLTATDHQPWRDSIRNGVSDRILHEKFLELLHTYLWLGGMPAVVQSWLERRDPRLCQDIQDQIIQADRQDFSKYVRRHRIEHVAQVFAAVPAQLGQKFRFAHVDSEARSYALKEALLLLERAGIVHLIHHSSASRVPLGAGKNEKFFKAFFFDTGLAQKILGLNLKNWSLQPIKTSNIGPLCEQFVAQEWMAYSQATAAPELYYWHREEKNSQAEVDFLFTKDQQVIPVEVKSGTQGGLKSLHAYLGLHPLIPYGLKISEGFFGEHGNIRELPLYGLESWFN